MKSLLGPLLFVAASCASGFAVPAGEPSKGLVTRIEATQHEVQGRRADPGPLHEDERLRAAAQAVAQRLLAESPHPRLRPARRAAPLTEQGRQRFKAFAPGGARDKNFPSELAAGKEDATEGNYNLLDLYDLKKPGLYSVQYLYEEYQAGWQGQVWSNVLVIEIVEK